MNIYSQLIATLYTFILETTCSSALIVDSGGVSAAQIGVGNVAGGRQEASLDVTIFQLGSGFAVFLRELSASTSAALCAATSMRAIVAPGGVDPTLILFHLDDGSILSSEAYPCLPE